MTVKAMDSRNSLLTSYIVGPPFPCEPWGLTFTVLVSKLVNCMESLAYSPLRNIVGPK